MVMQGKNVANALCICEYFNEALPQKYTPKTAPDAKVIAYVHRRAQLGHSKKEYSKKEKLRVFGVFLPLK